MPLDNKCTKCNTKTSMLFFLSNIPGGPLCFNCYGNLVMNKLCQKKKQMQETSPLETKNRFFIPEKFCFNIKLKNGIEVATSSKFLANKFRKELAQHGK